MKRLLVAGAAAVLTAAALLLGGIFAGGSAQQPSAVAAVPVNAARVAGAFASGNTAASVSRLQSALRVEPKSVRALDLLGLAYQQRARETGDPAYYTKSEGVLRRALRLAPHDFLATGGLASLALSRHRFREALVLGRTAHALAPSAARPYGAIGDALSELGRYEEAFAAYNKMVGLKPSLSAYARISYARELIGDIGGAASAMQLAASAGVGQPEALAWAHLQLGKLFWNNGRLAAAEREYRTALERFPGYVYAFDTLAQVEAARGRYAKAIALERRAVETIPLPQFVSTLGDLYALTGQRRSARAQYATVEVIRRLLVANGVKTDLETALFDVDHGIRVPRALELARQAYRDRPSIDGADVLAWALERTGRCADARGYSQKALRLGTRDALKFFHRGMIERCLGHEDAARVWFRRALRLNPHFSLLWAPVAKRLGR